MLLRKRVQKKMKKYILYNPLAGNSRCKSDIEALCATNINAEMVDMCSIDSYADFFSKLDDSDEIILCGGDGTLNHFVNDIKGIDIKNRIFYYAVGSGNDFARDLGKKRADKPDYPINEYIKDLPTVYVNGMERLFINGIGYGVDGYCCEEGDKIRAKNKLTGKNKPINYIPIALKGLIYAYKPTNATITIDGQKFTYKRVWLAPTMNGRFFGGGVMATPDQKRIDKDKKVSVMLYHGAGRFVALVLFPTIFKGTHVKYNKVVKIHSGKNVTVEFDRPTPLQIDGETVLGVRSYTVKV